MDKDYGIRTLLEMDGTIIEQQNGFWIKIEAWETRVSKDIPHGIRYNLTLHNPYGKRIMGYDNAHLVKLPKKYKYAGTITANDHRHRSASDKGIPYEFKDAAQLLTDFFKDVDKKLNEVNKES